MFMIDLLSLVPVFLRLGLPLHINHPAAFALDADGRVLQIGPTPPLHFTVGAGIVEPGQRLGQVDAVSAPAGDFLLLKFQECSERFPTILAAQMEQTANPIKLSICLGRRYGVRHRLWVRFLIGGRVDGRHGRFWCSCGLLRWGRSGVGYLRMVFSRNFLAKAALILSCTAFLRSISFRISVSEVNAGYFAPQVGQETYCTARSPLLSIPVQVSSSTNGVPHLSQSIVFTFTDLPASPAASAAPWGSFRNAPGAAAPVSHTGPARCSNHRRAALQLRLSAAPNNCRASPAPP